MLVYTKIQLDKVGVVVVDLGLNFISLLGVLDLVLSVVFLIASIVLSITRRWVVGQGGITLYVFQGFIAPIILLICGAILVFYGWMLNSPLQLVLFLLHLLIVYLAVKDIIIFDRLYDRFRGRY